MEHPITIIVCRLYRLQHVAVFVILHVEHRCLIAIVVHSDLGNLTLAVNLSGAMTIGNAVAHHLDALRNAHYIAFLIVLLVIPYLSIHHHVSSRFLIGDEVAILIVGILNHSRE